MLIRGWLTGKAGSMRTSVEALPSTGNGNKWGGLNLTRLFLWLVKYRNGYGCEHVNEGMFYAFHCLECSNKQQ